MSDNASPESVSQRRWTENWLIRDSALLTPIVLAVVLGGIVLAAMPAMLQAQVQQVLTLLAVAGSVGAALTVSFAGRLDGDPAALRIGSGLLVYGGLVLPIAAAGFATSIGPVGQLLDLLALASATVLFGLGLSRRGEPTLSWPAAAVAVAGSLAVVASTALAPGLVPGETALALAIGAVATVLLGVGVASTVSGLRLRSVLLRRVGLGMMLLAVAHGARGLVPMGIVLPWPALTGLRPIAVAVILAGVLPHLRAALRRQRDRDLAAASAVRAAEDAGDAAERDAHDRDHEMRNLVLGLSGAAALLAGKDDDRTELGDAVTAELERLTRMLDSRTAPTVEPGTVDVHRALATAVAVQRASGATIDLDVPAGLRTIGSAETLVQVVTNLLINCARHAAGSAVRVSASAVDGGVQVLVRDHGPGIAPGEERAALRRGRRSPVTGGSGLGLGISRDLMRAHGGDLHVGPAADGPGCLAVLEMPAAPARPLRELAS
ncbi:HAMP domain-containing sensor histidine kinase [Pseudonocardia sp.]|uniref:sensor histidine kinase n=1 Tax=Pseudonocardia sp. TaxID=60912 RepID=UPI0026340990|nr:HAMP domain-containing sensor histidine kinase [Pseudonocardia sp.]